MNWVLFLVQKNRAKDTKVEPYNKKERFIPLLICYYSSCLIVSGHFDHKQLLVSDWLVGHFILSFIFHLDISRVFCILTSFCVLSFSLATPLQDSTSNLVLALQFFCLKLARIFATYCSLEFYNWKYAFAHSQFCQIWNQFEQELNLKEMSEEEFEKR